MATLTLSSSYRIPDQPGLSAPVSTRSDTQFERVANGLTYTFKGVGFQYGNDGEPSSGVLNGLDISSGGNLVVRIALADVQVSRGLQGFSSTPQASNFLAFLRDQFASVDTLTGSDGNDYLIGYDGADSLSGGIGNDTLDGDEAGFAGANDTVDGGAGADTIRGLDGDDLLRGGVGDDDVNGNLGADTVYGGDGNDLVRGGQGNDVVYGEVGNDVHVNGNIGNDTVYGGDGNDQLFGGQDDDRLFGDEGIFGNSGLDTLSGDLGNDTLTGGGGADLFVMGSSATGNDVVTDFNYDEGDRIRLAPGTVYEVTTGQGGAMLVLGMGNTTIGAITLTGVAVGSVRNDWVVFG